MKIAGMITAGKGEADRRLEEVLIRNSKLVDEIYAVANNTDRRTYDMLNRYCKVWVDNREWGEAQHQIKQRLYSHIQADWVLSFDSDEVMCPELTRDKLEYYATKPQYDSYHLYFVQLWDDEKHHNPDLGFWDIRFFTRQPGAWENKPLHCGMAPKWAYQVGWYMPHIVIHYGLMTGRQRKVDRYKQFDPKAKYMHPWYYDQLENGRKEKLNLDLIIKDVSVEVNSYQAREKRLMPMNEEKKFYYVKRKSDGQILDIPEDHLEQTMEDGNFELISKEPIVVGGSVVKTTKQEKQTLGDEVPEEEIKEAVSDLDDTECEVCGFVAKNKTGLKAHARKHS